MRPAEILLIDNYDSFTYNICDYLRRLGAKVKVTERAACSPSDFSSADGLVFSPGPGNPTKLPDLQSLIREAVFAKPVLGICLGHQAIAAEFGADIVKGEPKHGKLSRVYRKNGEQALVNGLPSDFQVVRYHSLQVKNLPEPLIPLLETAEGELMAFCHLHYPVAGIQFHPEAWLTEFGTELLKNWLDYFVRK